MKDNQRTICRLTSIFSATLFLAGCFLSEPETTAEQVLSGSVGDGPVVGASITISDASGQNLATVSSDATAGYVVDVSAAPENYPLLISAIGGIDLVTNAPLDFSMTSAVLTHDSAVTANINPYSTLIIQTALQTAGGLSQQNVSNVTWFVTSHLNFGLDPELLADPISGRITHANVANVVKSSEAVGESLRRVSSHLAGAGYDYQIDDVLAALSADMVDGKTDGRGFTGADARISAVMTLVSAQVLVESLSNDLIVGGSRAEPDMDAAILVTAPDAPASTRTGQVVVNAGLLEHANLSLSAAYALSASTSLAGVRDAVLALQPGMTADQVRLSLPADASLALSHVISLAVNGTDEQLDIVNAAVRGESTETEPENQAPAIWGTPATVILADNLYSFMPSTSDSDGDNLSFSVLNLPGWASFDTQNGELYGSPMANNAGNWENIVISVSDGSIETSLPPFSINVVVEEAEPVNQAPVIWGTPATVVLADNLYSFVPSASDSDGDNLSFSVLNLPGWASFDTQNGELYGSPTANNAGNWENIVISVSDGSIETSLLPFSINVVLEEAELSATRVIQQQNNTGTLLEVMLAESGLPLNGATVSGSLLVRSTVSASALWCCKKYKFESDGSISVDVPHNAAWYRRPVAVDSIHEFDISSLANGDYELYMSVTNGDRAYIVFTVDNSSLPAETPPANQPPHISGNPPASVVVDDTYMFAPAASDPDGDLLSFEIQNLPAWLSFNDQTGALSGTPGAGDAGFFSGITITVSDGEYSVSLDPFSISVTDAPDSNRAPEISGNPADAVLAQFLYSFTPAASDADGDTLQFSIQNLPSWANFDASSGQLAGTPSVEDVGTYYNIVISVSDGALSDSLGPFSITVTDAATGYATLSWLPPTEREDGTLLDGLAAYKVYKGMSTATLELITVINDAQMLSYYFDNLPSGTHYFAVAAIDNNGASSALSNVASKTIL